MRIRNLAVTAFALLALALLAPMSARAQMVNPGSVTWDQPEWENVQSYELAYFALPVKADHTCDWAGVPAPVAQMTNTFPRPVTTTGLGMTAPLVSKPMGCFVAKLRAAATTAEGLVLFSPWSDSSLPFAHLPAQPGNLVLK